MSVELVMTSSACPEQYEAKLDGKTVGYLRLRRGYFYAACPGVGGEVVYSAEMYDSDGDFSEAERAEHMPKAVAAIEQWIARQVSVN